MTINSERESPDVGIPRHLAASMTVGEQQEWLRRYLDRPPGEPPDGVEGRRKAAPTPSAQPRRRVASWDGS